MGKTFIESRVAGEAGNLVYMMPYKSVITIIIKDTTNAFDLISQEIFAVQDKHHLSTYLLRLYRKLLGQYKPVMT